MTAFLIIAAVVIFTFQLSTALKMDNIANRVAALEYVVSLACEEEATQMPTHDESDFKVGSFKDK